MVTTQSRNEMFASNQQASDQTRDVTVGGGERRRRASEVKWSALDDARGGRGAVRYPRVPKGTPRYPRVP